MVFDKSGSIGFSLKIGECGDCGDDVDLTEGVDIGVGGIDLLETSNCSNDNCSSLDI